MDMLKRGRPGIPGRIATGGGHEDRKGGRASPGGLARHCNEIMRKRTLVLGGLAVLAAIGIVAAMRGGWWSGGAVAQSQRETAARAAPVEVATAVKKTVPV